MKHSSVNEMIRFDEALPMLLYRTLDAVMPSFRSLFARFDLTEQQWRVLRVLWDRGAVSSRELARLALLPPPSLVGIIDRLEKKGFVHRQRSTADRRIVHVAATPKGKTLQKQVMPLVNDIYQAIESRIDHDDWQHMADTLNRIIDQHGPTGHKTSNGGTP
jgi:homoprotocatechuate degradation regulator HpaR